jgi:hypothetical protein
MKKSQNMRVWLSKMVLASIFAQLKGGARHNTGEECNKYDLTPDPCF